MAGKIISRLAGYSKPFIISRAAASARLIVPVGRPIPRSTAVQCRWYSQAESAQKADNDYHSIIKDTEQVKGESNEHEFVAETRMLLDIVAKSLYSDKEVFIRELISNASDALEKLRYTTLSQGSSLSSPLEIHIGTDKQNRILTIQDTGIGMTKEELISNLGTIAKSGSKAFLEELKAKGESGAADPSSIIGQFGVGFYSSFMVAEKVDVFTKSHQEGAAGYKWSSSGTGMYAVQEAEGVLPGTKIQVHLRTDCREFADEDTVKKIINKYSSFVGSPIFLNGKQVNVIQPLWLMDPKEVKPEQHDEFYRFVGNTYDRPRFTLHYKTDSPLMIRALLYFPQSKPSLFELSRDSDIGIALYSRKVLITNRADNIVPKWLRFVKGVVDSEDIPLNLSRELLQNSALIAKLRTVLTSKILKFLHDKATKSPEEYKEFYEEYGLFFKEGIVVTSDVLEKEEIAKLLMFESSKSSPGVRISLNDYVSRLDGRRDIYYLCAPNRTLAESSPYIEALKKKDVEVLFCYEPYDEIVLLQLREFGKFPLTSVEKEMREDKESDSADLGGDVIKGEIDTLKSWFKTTLEGRVGSVKTTQRLDAHPCVVTVEHMGFARQALKQQGFKTSEEDKYKFLNPQLEINPKHPIIKKLTTLKTSDPKLAELVAKQLFSNAMVAAGLMDDPRTALTGINELLSLALEKH